MLLEKLTHIHRMINWTGGGENLLQPQEAINFSAKVHMQGENTMGCNPFWRSPFEFLCIHVFSRISWLVQKSLNKQFLNRQCSLIETFDDNDVLKMVEIQIIYKSIISTWGKISPHCERQSWGRPHARTRQHLLMILEIYMSTRC